jgi:hypothetical protein
VLCGVLASTAFLTAQTTWEFDGRPYDYQKAHFDSATKAVKMKLGVQMRTFGAPYNQIDTTFIRVFSEDTSYKVLLFGQNNPNPSTDAVNLTKRVNIESATGVPSYSTFLADYSTKKATYTEYMVMQGHPYQWTTTAKMNEFKQIVEYLISEGVKFVTPYEYYRYLTDLSIPRTTKLHVLLKLDDFRPTSTFFLPCFPTYDYLISKGVKAGIGVNFMWSLQDSQIDTIQYYLSQKDSAGLPLFELWNHGLDHSMSSTPVSGGNWSSTTTWESGVLPTGDDDVTVAAGSTIVIDTKTAACKNLFVNGTFSTATNESVQLTVHGNVQINSGGAFNAVALTGATANVIHTLVVHGNFTNSGGKFDFRAGSNGSTLRAIHTTFTGNTNSTIMAGDFSSSNNGFNGITVDKTDGAKIICGSDVSLDQGATGGSSQLVFINGMIETGNHSFNVFSLNSADIIGASDSTYVNGMLGRGMSNSSPTTKFFPVGDDDGYRPISVTSTTSGVASTHHVKVRSVRGNANAGTTAYTNGIDTVSGVRYYEILYDKGVGAGAVSMTFSRFQPSYGMNDGVTEGNTDLRVAYSVDGRKTWNGIPQSTAHTTSLSDPPTTIAPDTLASPITLQSGVGTISIALARKSGTNSNPLPVPEENKSIPNVLRLSDAFPNPFNPTTTIEFSVPNDGHAVVRIYNALGQEIATLFSGLAIAGLNHRLTFDAKNLPSGMYFSTMQFEGTQMVKRLLLLK